MNISLMKVATRYGFLFIILMCLTSISTVIVNAETSYKVRKSDNLDRIVRNFYVDRSLSKAQIILEIFKNNPHAFKKGNINSLILGADLQLPDESSITAYSEEAAGEVLSQQQKQQDEGTDFSLSELVKSIQNNIKDKKKKEANKELEASQKQQSLKIKKLEDDSNQLRVRLEQLLSEKKQRDKKLIELEKAIEDSLAIESKEIPSNTSTEIITIDGGSDSDSKPSGKAKATSTKKPKLDITNAKVVQKKGSKGEKEQRLKQDKNYLTEKEVNFSQWLWLIPLILIIGYLLKTVFRQNKSKNPSYDEMLEAKDLNPDIVDTHFEQQPLELVIKLDVAKAYLDMNEKATAQKLLEEIVANGEAKLKKEARDLLDSMT